MKEAVRGLCEASFKQIELSANLVNSPGPKCLYTGDSASSIANSDTVQHMLRCTDWGIFLSSCLKKLNEKNKENEESETQCKKEKEDFVQVVAIRCLAMSTVNFILPQNRGLTMEQDERLFTMNSLEQLLIKSKLRYVLPH